ncbi:hypothetical protein M2272_005898 [Mycobacterium frederiksbergense]|uniref:DUF222 domain-containing protein n=1 Tax=Mycolicibacterium frederiksbergense TaxID=117567 RepID=A0ABT6L8J2_9MYCO|nr:hypothetical protein [Mycolicibacterium frederiksbergense]
MNATDDGQPVGQGPIDAIDAIRQAVDGGMLQGADEFMALQQLAERQAAALNDVRRLHQPTPNGDDLGLFSSCCAGCSIPSAALYVRYPCPTMRAIDKAGV